MNKYQKKVHRRVKAVLFLANVIGLPEDYKLAKRCVKKVMRGEKSYGWSK